LSLFMIRGKSSKFWWDFFCLLIEKAQIWTLGTSWNVPVFLFSQWALSTWQSRLLATYNMSRIWWRFSTLWEEF
jgi:hypothetical protein